MDTKNPTIAAYCTIMMIENTEQNFKLVGNMLKMS